MAADPYVRVLLVESDRDSVSVLTLCLTEIKECQLHIAENIARALVLIEDRKPDLILFSHSTGDADGLRVLTAIHEKNPTLYLLVSLPESDAGLMSDYMRAGATDCIVKDRNYVPQLMMAVKNALIRLSERESFELPPLSRADQFAMDENLPDLVFLIDPQGKILHANRAITATLGFQQSQVIHLPFVDFLGGEGRTAFLDYLDRLAFSQNFRGPVSLKNRQGEEEQFEINCTFLEDVIYGVLKRDSSWEAIADMLDGVTPDDTAAQEEDRDAEDTHAEEDLIPSRMGPYRVVTLLGAGAMGRVYKGYDELLDRFVAIKVVNRALAADRESLERFHREAKILASISHPNIALIYHYGNTQGPPFFCMEFMPGGSLEDVLQKQGRLDPEAAIAYTMQVALGLSETMKKSVIHLDIKPSNLMIGENDRIKIVDFGLAKRARDLEGGSMSIVGTPHYIAPEQLQGQPADFRSDIYSLGVTLYRMLFGSTPFSGNTVVEILHNQFHKDIPARENLVPLIPQTLYDIIRRMIARDPARRYVSYSELIQDLENSRRTLQDPEAAQEIPRAPETTILLRGLLYDQPFAEVLGEIIRRKLNGKLTLSWIDLRKNIYFKDGSIVAVLSNQEGESFIDLLMSKHHLTAKSAKRIKSNSVDLDLHFTTAMSQLNPEVLESVAAEVRDLAMRILQGTFSWMIGEFMFEPDVFRGQIALQIAAGDILVAGVKQWVDAASMHRRLFHGQCQIVKSADLEKLLPAIRMKPADVFLLFRFDKEIHFQDLFNLSGISEDEFYRLIYLFQCAGIVTVTPIVAREPAPARPIRKPVAAKKAKDVSPTPPPLPKATASPAPTAPPAQEPPKIIAEPATPGIFSAPKADMGQYYFKLAYQSYRNKNFWAAVEYCKKALEHRKDAATLLLMGNAFATHPNFRFEAMDAYKQALELDQDNPIIHRDMGALYFKTGNLALARARYQDALRLDPADTRSARRLEEIAGKSRTKKQN